MAVGALAIAQQAAGALGSIPGAVGKVTGAFNAIPDAVKGVVGSIRQFTDALNPQAGLNFDRAVQSLNATIGFGLEPVIGAATVIMDQFAGSVSDAFTSLRDPIAKVSGLIVSVMQPVFSALSSVMSTFARAVENAEPNFRALAVSLEGALSVASVLVTIGAEVALALQEMTLGMVNVGKIADWLKGQFLGLGKSALLATDFFLRSVGMSAHANRILEALAKEPAKFGRTPAPVGFGTSDLMSIYQRRLEEAAKGGAGSIEEQQLDVMKEIRDFAAKQLELAKADPNAAARQGRQAVQALDPRQMAAAILAEIINIIRGGGRNNP